MRIALFVVGGVVLGLLGRSADENLTSQFENLTNTSEPIGKQAEFRATSTATRDPMLAETVHIPKRPRQPVEYPTTGIAMWDPLPDPASGVSKWETPEPLLPDEERRVIIAVKNHLGMKDDLSEFNVKRKGTGYTVFVTFYSPDEQGNKVTYPGGHCIVKLSSDRDVIEVIRGL